MKATLLLSALAVVAVVGCGGSGASTSSIPLNKITYVAALSATQDGVYSANPDGSGQTLHSQFSKDIDVWDVDQAGSRLLAVFENPVTNSFDVKLCQLNGSVILTLTSLNFDEISSAQFSRDYTKVAVSGYLNGGTVVVITANADGSGVQRVDGKASLGVLTSTNQIAIGGLSEGELGRPFVGLMSRDGNTVANIVDRAEALDIDELNGDITYSSSIGGDESGVTGVSIARAGSAPRVLFPAGTSLNGNPKFSTSGSSVFFVREGVGIFSVSVAGGTPAQVVASPQITRILRVR